MHEEIISTHDLWRLRNEMNDLENLFSMPKDQMTEDQLVARFYVETVVGGAYLKEGIKLLNDNSNENQNQLISEIVQSSEEFFTNMENNLAYLQSKGIKAAGNSDDLEKVKLMQKGILGIMKLAQIMSAASDELDGTGDAS